MKQYKYRYNWLLLGVLLAVFSFARTCYCVTFKAKQHLRVDGSAYFDEEYDYGNKGNDFTIDWNNGNKQKVTLTGDINNLSFIAPPGTSNLLLKVVQDSTGNRTITNWNFATPVKWPGGESPTLSTAADAVDIITFYYDADGVSPAYYGVGGFGFSTP